MVGRATFTTVLSSVVTKTAKTTAASVTQRRSWDGEADGDDIEGSSGREKGSECR
jgi:hypothetical protein